MLYDFDTMRYSMIRYEVEVKMITRCTTVNVKDDVKNSNGNEHNCLFENIVTPEIHARGLWLAARHYQLNAFWEQMN